MSRDKPLLVYDGDCGFCRRWIARWKAQTGDRVAYATSKEFAPSHPEIPPSEFAGSVQLIEGGKRYRGAEAVFRALSRAPGGGLWLKVYRALPPFAAASETFYRLVARHRVFFSRLTSWLWGAELEPAGHHASRWLFLRLMGFIYLAAFGSFWMQASGLIGPGGILPFPSLLEAVGRRFGAEAYRLVPTLLWLKPTAGALSLLCGSGTLLSVVVILDFAPGPALFALWVLYLSLVDVGGDFLSFQWDMLLLETGFLAALWAPWRLRPNGKDAEPSRVWLWLLRFLLFRLMFESGCVKLMSGDSAWRELTALTYHYETQPLPTWLGWYAHLLPAWFHRACAAAMFAVELGAPWLIFLPRRPRLLAAGAFSSLMLLIALTGNYCFFNLLAAALCVTLCDDLFWEGVLPKPLWRRAASAEAVRPAASVWRGRLRAAAAAPLVLAGLLQLTGLFRGGLSVPSWVAAGFNAVQNLRLVNSYGLFAVMTRPRYEIAVEGSEDGGQWREYTFKWKPGPLSRGPGFVAPLQPRLDWQMWFAALGSLQDNRWFVNFLSRLFEGRPEVLALLEKNPFPQAPPAYLRATLYEYRFTTWAERRATGDWWVREFKRPYCPVLSSRPQGGPPQP